MIFLVAGMSSSTGLSCGIIYFKLSFRKLCLEVVRRKEEK